MPQGIKPNVAINKILGKYLADNGFVFDVAHGNQAYFYKRNYSGSMQQLWIDIAWAPEFMVKEYEKYKNIFSNQEWDAHQHRVRLRLSSLSPDNFYKSMELDGIIEDFEHPHLKRPLAPEQMTEWRGLYKINPLLNGYFVTQEELEQRLTVLIQAMEQYGRPFLEDDNYWTIGRKIDNVNDRKLRQNEQKGAE
jgi:hypothetical protein